MSASATPVRIDPALSWLEPRPTAVRTIEHRARVQNQQVGEYHFGLGGPGIWDMPVVIRRRETAGVRVIPG